MVVVVVVRMVVGSLVMLVATLTTKAAASVRSERQADLIRHQLLKDLGMEAAPDTSKVGKRLWTVILIFDKFLNFKFGMLPS